MAKTRLIGLLYERRDLGRYGLGKTLSLDVFAKFSGIDYDKRKLVQYYQPTRYFEVSADAG